MESGLWSSSVVHWAAVRPSLQKKNPNTHYWENGSPQTRQGLCRKARDPFKTCQHNQRALHHRINITHRWWRQSAATSTHKHNWKRGRRPAYNTVSRSSAQSRQFSRDTKTRWEIIISHAVIFAMRQNQFELHFYEKTSGKEFHLSILTFCSCSTSLISCAWINHQSTT